MRLGLVTFTSIILAAISADAADLSSVPDIDFEPSVVMQNMKTDHEKSIIMQAQLYVQYARVDQAIKLLSESIPTWDESEVEDLEKACELLFSAAYIQGRHKKYKDRLDRCSDSQMNVWYAEEERKHLAIVKVAPLMPREAVLNNITGYVIVEYDINKKGKPKSIKIVESTNEIFNRPTIKSVYKYLYLPTIEKGKVIETNGVRSKITFQIQG